MNMETLRRISYGMYIISSKKGEKLNGQIANTVFQITSEPPTIAVSINKQNLTHDCISGSGVFSVSILAKDTPMKFIGAFGFKSGRETDKFAGVKYLTGKTGAPVVLDMPWVSLKRKCCQGPMPGPTRSLLARLLRPR